ncbi:hypothetical protein GQ457_02G008810 [Hibiscus cannabinus]
MEKVVNAESSHLVVWLVIIIQFSLLFSSAFSAEISPRFFLSSSSSSPMLFSSSLLPTYVLIDNGLVQVTIADHSGHLLRIKYKTMSNVLETKYTKRNKGYWDLVWDNGAVDKLVTERMEIITQNDELVEVSFKKTWKPTPYYHSTVPLNIDKRYIVRRGVPGIYMYSILERQADFPDAHMYQIRLAFKLNKNKFRFMAVSDVKQGIVPTAKDRETGRCHVLAFKEAVLLTHPTDPRLRGQVDDKYQYSEESKDNRLHGWISDADAVGFWVITPSFEFRTGGPHKQELTSHVGPVSLSMFASIHYAGEDMDSFYQKGKPWKKVLGPVFIYLNSASPDPGHGYRNTLWNDAKRQLSDEIKSWPYNFVASEDFPHSEQRGEVNGQLLVRDKYIGKELIQAKSAFVGLAAPGNVGSWQTEGKGYQFWTETDETGMFSIKNVRPGVYNLYAWVYGFIGDYKFDHIINIQPGNKVHLDKLIYDPPRNGPTLWEIGIPDRTAAEFFIPEPNPSFVNAIIKDNADRFRQYGLWDRYSDTYRHGDVVYNVGVSNYSKDWFFAHVCRKEGYNGDRRTTWQIRHNLQEVKEEGNYTLQMALAAASYGEVQVRINDPTAVRPDFTTSRIGFDNAVARHGIHGLYRLYSINVPENRFRIGENTIFLKQTRCQDKMEKVVNSTHSTHLVLWLVIFIDFSLLFPSAFSAEIPPRKTNNGNMEGSQVLLHRNMNNVSIDNGLVEVTIEDPSGYLIGIKYKTIPNVLEPQYTNDNRGYWDLVWDNDAVDKLVTERVEIITQTEELVEVSFKKTWKPTTNNQSTVPLNIDKRYIVRRGVPGLYMYSILERQTDFPDAHMYQIRIAFKLNKEKFLFMAVSDGKQGVTPTAEDREPGRCQVLAFKEAVLLTNPTDPRLRGQVDDKYQYSAESKDNRLHGWISDADAVGFWVITPSFEFRTGGPHKQELTSHTGPISLSMFASIHYAGEDMDSFYQKGKPWKKVLGPVFIYLNSASPDPGLGYRNTLWNDAKRQLSDEIKSWPYNFVASEDFPQSGQRGEVNGQLLVRDKYMGKELIQAKSAFVGLAAPGNVGSWQTEGKGYQFWVQTDDTGRFSIKNVRPGVYNLYAWVYGFIGDYKFDHIINIQPGNKVNLDKLIYDPPRNGPTLWEIGIPDRTAAEFFIPEPNTSLVNAILKDNADRFRQYGLWDRYSDIYRLGDVVYNVGVSNYSKDWFFAHVCRKEGYNGDRRTTWQIKHILEEVKVAGTYTLQLALAAASYGEVQVRVNDPTAVRPHFTTSRIGFDNAVARHGIHGLYRLYSINLPGNIFRRGENTIFLRQPKCKGSFKSVIKTNNGNMEGSQVLLHRNMNNVSIDNGLVEVTIEDPSGYLIGIKYKTIPNVLEPQYTNDNRGYWDLVWDNDAVDKLVTERVEIITQTEELVEVSFKKTWKPTTNNQSTVPLNIDKRYIVRRGVPGLYMYSILERQTDFPDAHMYQIRIAFKLNKEKFLFMAVSDGKQGVTPTAEDREPGRCQVLAFKEAVLLTNPTDPRLRGQVDDKYQYSAESKDNRLHGWISDADAVGFWVITPSFEFRTGGPHKQELTSHTGPISLSMFASIHYAGEDMDSFYQKGKPWKKVLGPVFIYLNSASPDPGLGYRNTLWNDAKRQLSDEIKSWPYNFVASEDFPQSGQRGEVNGQLLVRDKYMGKELIQAKSAFVGLAAPGNVGSWQTEGKGYQFWVQTDDTGRFSIKNVRPGVYNLYAWVYGFIGDYKFDHIINIQPGNKVNLDKLIYDPPRNGPTLWEIGIPDRTAAEFFIPEPNTSLVNAILKDNADRFRQYGLWDRYSDIYRLGDVVYNVGVSNYSKDWFFAHVCRCRLSLSLSFCWCIIFFFNHRKEGYNGDRRTTWQIKHILEEVKVAGTYTLQLALAAASYGEVQVRVNDPTAVRPHFTTSRIGFDNAVARHGIHGLYRLYSINLPGNIFRRGENTIFLRQPKCKGSFKSVIKTNNGNMEGSQVLLHRNMNNVSIDNGLVEVTIEDPSGYLIGIKYKTIPNVLEPQYTNDNRGYWDLVWDNDAVDKLVTERAEIITQTEEYIVRRGVPGLYMYSILERQTDFPDAHMYQIRIAFKLNKEKFLFMAVSDGKQGVTPTAEDREPGRCQVLAFKEAVLLTNPTDPRLRGQVDDKYQYSAESKDNRLHGWISDADAVGFWVITPSFEFRTGGPHKQELTSHTGPISLSMFASIHYAGEDMDSFYQKGKPWKKVLGPVFIYLNSASPDPGLGYRNTLWNDAKRQLSDEIKSWPYNFVASEDFPQSGQRGEVNGQLLVRDKYMGKELIQAKSAFVGLAAPGNVGSWQTEGKGYQFWVQTDDTGRFSIKNVRPGVYNLYAWVYGFIGDYKFDHIINIQPGNKVNLDKLIYDPPRNGPTLWEIGIPDRTAAEFFIPEPNTSLVNAILKDNADRFRQYGLWDRYSDIYRLGDVVYNVGVSNYSKDWFFAHVCRKEGYNGDRRTTWQIKHILEEVKVAGTYTLQLALAAASYGEVQVRVNDPTAVRPHFTTSRIGFDNAVARHGIHGLYRLYSINLPGNIFRRGENTIFLRQPKCKGSFKSVMYDYIRLEGPAI